MGGDFSSRGQQDCSKGIYALAGMLIISLIDAYVFIVTCLRPVHAVTQFMSMSKC